MKTHLKKTGIEGDGKIKRSIYSWPTSYEISFLNEMPQTLANISHNDNIPNSRIKETYMRYLNSMDKRKNWGTMNKEKIRNHVKKLIEMY